MKHFAALYAALDETTSTNDKVAAMADYFRRAPPADAAWALYFLSGRKPRQLVQGPRLGGWAAAEAGLPLWLFDEAYLAVGDLGEVIALILPPSPATTGLPLHVWVEQRLLPLQKAAEADQRAAVTAAWREMDDWQRFVWNKLLTGAFRVGVSQKLVVRALSAASALPEEALAHRLMGAWDPTPEFYQQLLATDTRDTDLSRPYPFFLAYPVEGDPAALGHLNDFQCEWKWDGIRAQLIQRAGQTFLWSRGEENLTERFPELVAIGANLPDGSVIDGEILPWQAGRALPFAQLQRRIGRKTLTKKVLAEAPVVLMAYDLLEREGRDFRAPPLRERRAALARLVASAAHSNLLLSPLAEASGWAELALLRETSRERNAEGFMLKRLNSAYGVGRQVGAWWKWKIDPYTIDAVLIYAERGHGRRASLYTDYTFGVWSDGKLIPFAKAYSGLTDAEIRQVDAFVRRNTLESFGPVRTVTPQLVFELAFEGLQRSPRHKSGVAVRFPRIARWRTDKKIEDADTLGTLRALLPPETPA
jgi:DNA ligase-1